MRRRLPQVARPRELRPSLRAGPPPLPAVAPTRVPTVHSLPPSLATASSPHLPARPPPPPAAPPRRLRSRPSVPGTLQPRALTGPPRQSEHSRARFGGRCLSAWCRASRSTPSSPPRAREIPAPPRPWSHSRPAPPRPAPPRPAPPHPAALCTARPCNALPRPARPGCPSTGLAARRLLARGLSHCERTRSAGRQCGRHRRAGDGAALGAPHADPCTS